MAKLISTNPAKNYKVIGSVDISTLQEIKKKVADAHQAKTAWKEMGVKKRIVYLENMYQKFKDNKEKLLSLIIQETGKCVKDARVEVERYDNPFKWFLENAELYLQDEATHEDDIMIHKIVYEPFGVAAVITPWNHPVAMFVWGVIPNLLSGNVVVFKTSEECPLSGRLIEKIINSVKLPQGVFSEVYGDKKVGQLLMKQNINLVWFTGSSRAGKEVYKEAGKKFIKAILEMGGSNPGIIFENVDVDRFIDKIYAKRFLCCGQSCDALKRLIVHESLFDEVVQKLRLKIEEKKVGDPEDETTDIGSLAAKRQVDLLDLQVKDAIKKGAKVIIGGRRLEHLKGAYYLPTLLTNVKKNMRVWSEEVFGPVLVIVPFRTEEEALQLANDTKYGLGSLIFTSDKERAKRVSAKLESGTVEINAASHWLPCNPFGGYKESGMGREFGKQGFQELTQIKVISMEK